MLYQTSELCYHQDMENNKTAAEMLDAARTGKEFGEVLNGIFQSVDQARKPNDVCRFPGCWELRTEIVDAQFCPEHGYRELDLLKVNGIVPKADQ